MKLVYNEIKLNAKYTDKPQLIADAPIIYFDKLSNYQIKNSKYIQVYIKNNDAYDELFNCVVYHIGKFNEIFLKLPYKINYEISDVIINEDYRGKGYASKILKYIIKKLDGNIFLWTTVENIIAISLYTKLGFKQIKLNKKLINFYKSKNKWIRHDIIGMILIK
jgi:ribosomal protein S18 acetylase RimI-like enzyme